MVLQACAGRSPLLRDETPKELPFLLTFTDQATYSMNLPLLRESVLPEGAKEVRVWTGFGTVAPDFLLRFQIEPNGDLTGTMLAHFMRAPEDNAYNESVRSVLRAMCTSVQSNEAADSCAATASQEVHWKTIYRKLVREGLWTLPDESELPKPKFTLSDGSSIVVELRDGKSYRTYQYSNPLMLEGVAAEHAYALMRISGDITGPVFARALPLG
ncbi:MAG: hypothetical protein ABI843_10675 [Dokdonella sp.]